MYKKHIVEIIKLLKHCKDTELLDFILRLLQKSQET